MHQERLKKGVRGERDLKLSEWVRIEGTVERLLDRARLNLERELRRVSRGSSKRINLLPPRSERDKVGRAKDRARELLSMGVCEVSAGIESSMEVETSGGEKVGGIAVKPLDAANR